MARGRQGRSEQRNIACTNSLTAKSKHSEIGKRTFCLLRVHEFAQQCWYYVAECYPLILQCAQHAINANATWVRDENRSSIKKCREDISNADDGSSRTKKNNAIVEIDVARVC